MYRSFLFKLQNVVSNLLYKHELKHPIHMTIEYCKEDDVYINERNQRINISSLKVNNTFIFNKKKYIITDIWRTKDSLGSYEEAIAYQYDEYKRKFKNKRNVDSAIKELEKLIKNG